MTILNRPATGTSWDRLHPRLTRRTCWIDHTADLPIIEGTLIRLQVQRLPGDRHPKPMWLWSSHTPPPYRLMWTQVVPSTNETGDDTAQPVRAPPTTCSASAPVRSPRPRTARAPSSPSTTPAERNREMAPHTLVTRTWCGSVSATGGRLGVDLARGPDHAVHRRVQIPADSCAVELPAPVMAAWGAVALAQILRLAVRGLRHRRVAAGS